MFDDETMEKVMKRCQEDPEFKRVFEQLMAWGQRAAEVDMSVNEMASICMTGYAIGEDPSLKEMVKNMARISKLGLDIVDK
jgi:hypothetical protein